MRSGFIPFGTWRGVTVRIHWTALAIPLAFGVIRHGLAFSAAFFTLLCANTVGHVVVGRLHHLRLRGIDVHGLGGTGRWLADTTRVKQAQIAWGGMGMQLMLLMAALVVVTFAGTPRSVVGQQWAATWIWANTALFVVHLLPVAPFDGKEAWRIVPLLLNEPPPSTDWRMALRDTFREPVEGVLLESLEEERLSWNVKAQLDQIAADVRSRPARRSAKRQ